MPSGSGDAKVVEEGNVNCCCSVSVCKGEERHERLFARTTLRAGLLLVNENSLIVDVVRFFKPLI